MYTADYFYLHIRDDVHASVQPHWIVSAEYLRNEPFRVADQCQQLLVSLQHDLPWHQPYVHMAHTPAWVHRPTESAEPFIVWAFLLWQINVSPTNTDASEQYRLTYLLRHLCNVVRH